MRSGIGRTRMVATGLAAVALVMVGCGGAVGGTPGVVAGATVPTGTETAARQPSSEPILPTGLADPATSTDSPKPGSTAPGSTVPGSPDTGSTDQSGTGAAGTDTAAAVPGTQDKWPGDMCALMPMDLVQGMTKNDGNPELRCMYSSPDASRAVSITTDGRVMNDDPSMGEPDLKKTTVEGRPAWTWTTSSSAVYHWVAVVSGPDKILEVMAVDRKEDASAAKLALDVATRATRTLASGKVATSSVADNPPPALESGRAWPKVVCSLLPKPPFPGMKRQHGYEDQHCTYQDQDDNRIMIEREIISIDPSDPSRGLGTDVKSESFDGRKAFSYISGEDSAWVVFDTGAKGGAAVHVFWFGKGKEEVRKIAVDVAAEIAPHLPH